VAHACNPSYLGGRDQEDHSSKPVWANSLQNSISKKKKKSHTQKKGWWSGSKKYICMQREQMLDILTTK
jgi:hypothetical protein